MSDFFKALRIYTKMEKCIEDMSELKKEFDLNDKELKAVREFYEDTGAYQESEEQEVSDYIDATENSESNLIQKIDSLDVLNASLMAKYQELTNLETDPFSQSATVKVIDRRSSQLSRNQGARYQFKQIWMDAIVKHIFVELKIKKDRSFLIKNVKPVGLYYPDGTDRIKFVYIPEKADEIEEIEIADIRDCMLLSKRRFKQVAFCLDKYLEQKSNQEMILRIYHEAKVEKKLKDIFMERMQKLNESEMYSRFLVEVDAPMEYCRLLESFGMSVIVEKPKELREKIADRARESLAYYMREEPEE